MARADARAGEAVALHWHNIKAHHAKDLGYIFNLGHLSVGEAGSPGSRFARAERPLISIPLDRRCKTGLAAGILRNRISASRRRDGADHSRDQRRHDPMLDSLPHSCEHCSSFTMLHSAAPEGAAAGLCVRVAGLRGLYATRSDLAWIWIRWRDHEGSHQLVEWTGTAIRPYLLVAALGDVVQDIVADLVEVPDSAAVGQHCVAVKATRDHPRVVGPNPAGLGLRLFVR